MAKLIAIHRISHRIMNLEEEGVGITPIEEEKEEDATIMEVSNSFHHKQLKISLLKIPLRASSMNVQHARSAGNQGIKP